MLFSLLFLIYLIYHYLYVILFVNRAAYLPAALFNPKADLFSLFLFRYLPHFRNI